MIRAAWSSILGRVAAPSRHRSGAPAGESPAAATVEELAQALVAHVNEGDRAAFLRILAPTVGITSAARPHERTDVDAERLFAHLSSLAPGQTICTNRVRATEGRARLNLEISWLTASGACLSSLGTVDIVCSGGKVTALVLDLDLDPSVGRAAVLLGGAPQPVAV